MMPLEDSERRLPSRRLVRSARRLRERKPQQQQHRPSRRVRCSMTILSVSWRSLARPPHRQQPQYSPQRPCRPGQTMDLVTLADLEGSSTTTMRPEARSTRTIALAASSPAGMGDALGGGGAEAVEEVMMMGLATLGRVQLLHHHYRNAADQDAGLSVPLPPPTLPAVPAVDPFVLRGDAARPLMDTQHDARAAGQ